MTDKPQADRETYCAEIDCALSATHNQGDKGCIFSKPQAEALKPCPSCRASMEPYETHRLSEIYHRHPQNGCVFSDFRVSPDDQKAWNTRATLEPSEDMTLLIGLMLMGLALMFVLYDGSR